MPGVKSASASYSNNLTLGPDVDIAVRLDSVPIDQIEAVATRIADTYRQDFGKFRRSVSFSVGRDAVKHRLDSVDQHVELSPELVAADARAIRRIKSATSDSPPDSVQITWLRTVLGLELTLRGAVDDTALAAVRSAVGESPAHVRITPDSGTAWTVAFPFRSEDEDEVRGIVSRLPLSAVAVGVSAGHISHLWVEAPRAADAYAQLVSVIDLAAPTPDYPMKLRWGDSHEPGSGDQRRFRGSVHVGGCSYARSSPGELEPEKYYTAEEITVQKRLRGEYDSCPK